MLHDRWTATPQRPRLRSLAPLVLGLALGGPTIAAAASEPLRLAQAGGDSTQAVSSTQDPFPARPATEVIQSGEDRESSRVPFPKPATRTAPKPPPLPPIRVVPERGPPPPPAEQAQQLQVLPLPNLPTLAERPPAAATPTPAANLPPPALSSTGAGVPVSYASELARAQNRLGLGDTETARIQAAQTLAGAGQDHQALAALIALNDALDAATLSVVVKPGESMRQIAARPEVYANANLWPLIWAANRLRLPDPTHVMAGQTLKVPRYPSLSAASQAIEIARQRVRTKAAATAGSSP